MRNIPAFAILVFILILTACESPETPQKMLAESKKLEQSLHKYMDDISRYKTLNENILIYYPLSNEAGEACFNLGSISELFFHFEEATDFYLKLVQNYPENKFCPEALFRLGKIYHEKLEKDEEAIKFWQQLQGLFPHSELAKMSYWQMADLYLEKKEYNQAIAVLRKFTEVYPQNPLSDDILFRIGKIYQSEVKDSTAAKVIFKELKEKYPESEWKIAVNKELRQ